MDSTFSSANACRDPDRQIIEDFEKGDSNEPDITTASTEATGTEADDPHNVTFVIKGEDHTLGNALRWVISQQTDDVDFVGYTMPHPSELKIHLRIQCKSGSKRTAREILRDSIQSLHDIYSKVEQTFVDSARREGLID
jgi:DNA-directed RNA polymerase I and III subunit RPAC2